MSLLKIINIFSRIAIGLTLILQTDHSRIFLILIGACFLLEALVGILKIIEKTQKRKIRKLEDELNG